MPVRTCNVLKNINKRCSCWCGFRHEWRSGDTLKSSRSRRKNSPATGVVAAACGIYKLYRWATSDKPLSDKEIIDNQLSKTQKDQIDKIEKNLKAVNNKKHLEAYEKELKDGFLYDEDGKVKLNPRNGKSWNHIREVEQSEAKIEKLIEKLKNAQRSKLFIENTSEVTKKAVQDAIKKGQKFLNEVKKIRDSVNP
ncbi:hypothetical protein [Paenibacillus sp. sgz500992]|uniref:hypothetical protein n=1 Tax=Paenibacillus sp. sgz500992 TaxID=3242476 RepID=UPI0036D32B1C